MSPAHGCLLALALAIAPAALCLALGLLAVQGELVVGGGGLTETRLWLVREPASAGLGLSTGRIANGDADGPAACVETRVRFWLWRSDDSLAQTSYCDCYQRTGGSWQLVGACP